MVGLMATSSKRVMPYPGLLHSKPLPLQWATADLHLCKRHSSTQRWRREWQTTSVSLLENPMNSVKRQKDRTPKDEFPRLVGA